MSLRRRSHTRSGAVVAALALALAGCAPTYAGPPSNEPVNNETIEASRNSPTAPAAFLDRDELPSCGEVVLEQGESTADVAANAVSCLDGAFDSGAELVVVGPTTEGDPIVTYYRVGPTIEGMEIFYDSTLDQYGWGWSHHLCADATSFADQGECAEVE